MEKSFFLIRVWQHDGGSTDEFDTLEAAEKAAVGADYWWIIEGTIVKESA